MTGISNHAKRGEVDSFCEAVRNLANSVCGLTENATQVIDLYQDQISGFKKET